MRLTGNRIMNVLLKEWQLLFTDLNSVLLMTLLPMLIVAQGVAYVWLAARFGGETMMASPVFQSALSKLLRDLPALAQDTGEQQLLVLLLSQFTFFLLLVPTMIAINVATFSIVDEKVSGSLEALLATPVRTWELLLAKALAGAIPALVVTWLSAGVFLLVVSGLGWGTQAAMVTNANWFLMLFLLTPAVAILSFMLGVIGSSRANDAKGAQSLAVIVVLPVLALIGVQVTGIAWFTPLLTLALAVGIAAADAITLFLAVRLFQRETVLTRWR
jgi:ABC-2 type transport system permease protein